MPISFNETLKTKFVENFINSVSNNSISYYVGFGKNSAWDDDQNPPNANNSLESYHYNVQRELLFGKRVVQNDTAYIIRRIVWASGTVYDQYDHTDSKLFYKNYYVINSDNRVYKCLFNNYGAPSTVMPKENSVIGDFDTGDGYKWKYMYLLNASHDTAFSTRDYMAIINDSGVTASAEDGAIHVCLVSNSGYGYISANGQIDDIVDNYTFKLPNTVSSSVVGAYNASVFYAGGDPKLSSSIIQNYTTNSSGRYVTTADPITHIENNRFVITPQVKFTGDGQDAFAISIVDPLHGEISGVHVISRGTGYNHCTTEIIANTFIGTGATTYPIISPKGGHAANNVYELGCRTLGISVTTNPSDNLYDWVDYRQTSLLYNPTAVSNGAIFRDNTFKQMTAITISHYTHYFTDGEIVRGDISGAYGIFVYMTDEIVYLKEVVGTFSPSETIGGIDSFEYATISSINNQDIVSYTADVLYYKNFEPISRQGITTEQVKLYFSI
jgi:hypothetical protein